MDWLKRHSLKLYFIMVLSIAYGSLILFAGLDGLASSKAEMDRLFPILIIFLLLGPIFSGFFLTFLSQGKEGLKAYFKPVLRWRISLRWYASLLILPLVIFIILWLLSFANSDYLPAIIRESGKIQLIFIGLSIGFFGGGLFEEFGWTGFLMDKMNLNRLITTGLIIGLIWGIWHLPITYFASVDENGVFSWAMFLPTLVFYMMILPIYRIIMVHVYYVNRSLVFSMLMHMGLTSTTVFIFLPNVIGDQLILYYIILFFGLVIGLFFIRRLMKIKSII